MKKFIFMEGFKDWPATSPASQSTINAFLTKNGPYSNGLPTLQAMTSGSVGIVNNSYEFDGIKYSGIYLAGGNGSVGITLPKFAQGDKARTYIGGRLVGTTFSTGVIFYTLTNGTAPSTGNFDSTSGASYYLEFVIDHSTSVVSIYVNKLKKFENNLTTNEIANIAKGAGKLCFGSSSIYAAIFGSKPGVMTDFYIATETWEEDTAPPIEVFGPVSVDTYNVSSADAPGFSTDAESIPAALKAPYKNTYAVKDQPVYTDNDGGVGKFTFDPVSPTAKPVAAMCSILAMRGPSSGAALATKVTDGTKVLASGQYVPAITTEAVSPVVYYDLTPELPAVTPDNLNKIVVELNSTEIS